jgi:molybdopterin molybdotransferase
MLNLEQALETILSNVNVLGTEEKPLLECIGQVTAEDIYSGYYLPMADTSIPDGYAVRSSDITGASRNSPVTLRIIGTVRARLLLKTSVNTGTAVRSMTGSIMPNGADCVVRFEDTDEPANKNGPNTNNPSDVRIYVAEKPGANTRPAGTTVSQGTLVLPRRKAVGPAQISALTAIGRNKIKVIRRPKIAVVATGDEIVNLGKPLSAGKSYNCNAPSVSALIKHYGGMPQVLGIARDNEPSLLAKIQKGMTADAIITTGGVSMGDYDLVRLVTDKIGRVIFYRIEMGPGKSFAFGIISRPERDGGDIPLFALSGPPAGCLNNFETLVRPAIFKMRGFIELSHPVVEALAEDSVPGKKPFPFIKWTYLHKAGKEYKVTLNSQPEAGLLTEMAAANSITIIPGGTEVRKGDKIQVMPLDWV